MCDYFWHGAFCLRSVAISLPGVSLSLVRVFEWTVWDPERTS